MKTKTKLYLGGVLALLIIIGTALMLGQGELFKGFSMGKFGKGKKIPSLPPAVSNIIPRPSSGTGQSQGAYTDLKIDSYRFTDATGPYEKATKINLEVVVSNGGSQNITTPFYVAVNDSTGRGGWYQTQRINNLPVNRATQVFFTKVQKSPAQKNAYRYQIMVDSSRVINESNENNNILETHTYPYIGVKNVRLETNPISQGFNIAWTNPDPSYTNKLEHQIRIYTGAINQSASTGTVGNTPFDLLPVASPYTSYVSSLMVDSAHFSVYKMSYTPGDAAGNPSDLANPQKDILNKFLNRGADQTAGASTVTRVQSSGTPSETLLGIINDTVNQIITIVSEDKVTGAGEVGEFVIIDSVNYALTTPYMVYSFWADQNSSWRDPAPQPDCVNWPFAEDDWMGRIIAKVYERGLLNPIRDCGPGPCRNECHLYGTVNKAQAAMWLYRASGLIDALQEAETERKQVFDDVSQNSWYFEAVQALYERGYLPDPGPYFNPSDTATKTWYTQVLERIPVNLRIL